MFRKPTKKQLTPYQVAARQTYAGSNANTIRNVSGAYGFTAGVASGTAIGGVIGAAVGAAGLGVGAIVTTPIGMAIGASIGGGGGIGIGRHVAPKLETDAEVEQRKRFGLLAEDADEHNLIKPKVMLEIDRMERFISLLCESKVVINTKSNFFDQVHPLILTDTQKILYNTILDSHILEIQIQRSKLFTHEMLWKDPVKMFTLNDDMQMEQLVLRKKRNAFTILYIEEKKQRLHYLSQEEKLIKDNKHEMKHHSSNRLLNCLVSSVMLLDTLEEWKIIKENISNLNLQKHPPKEEKMSSRLSILPLSDLKIVRDTGVTFPIKIPAATEIEEEEDEDPRFVIWHPAPRFR